MQSAAKLQRLSPKARMAEWTADFELLTTEAKAELAGDHFTAAICKYREAVNVARACAMEEAAVRLGVELATEILPLGSRLAKALLLEAAEADSGKAIPAALWNSIDQQEREEAIYSAPRLPAPVAAPAEKPKVVPIKVVPVKTSAVQTAEAPVRAPRAGQRSPRAGQRDWNFLATAATLAFTVAALGIAAGLIWMNASRRAHKPLTADDRAWRAVNMRDADLVESYLLRFPVGAHRGQAVLALSAIRVEHRESAEVGDALREYETAWNARNRPMIMELSVASTPRIEGNQAMVRCIRKVSGVSADGGAEQNVVFVLRKQKGTWMIESDR